MKRIATILRFLGLAAALAGCGAAVAANPVEVARADPLALSPLTGLPAVKRAEFRGQYASPEVERVADWAVHSGDNARHPFIIVDKAGAKAYAFDRNGTLIDATAVLLGMGVGDKFAPGVLQMDMYKTKPWQRITPAGRYFAEEDRNLQGETVLWVDYDSGIAIHKLPAKRTKQRRHERIVSPDPAEHRITYGCINVPPAFYDRVVRPYFGARGGVVYVLPDTVPLNTVFRTDEVSPRPVAHSRQAAGERPPTIQRF